MITEAQHLALAACAVFNEPAHDRFTEGVRDACAALRKILEERGEDRAGLETALRAYLPTSLAPDGGDYQWGMECVHSDVQYVLDDDPHTIAELLGTLNTEGD